MKWQKIFPEKKKLGRENHYNYLLHLDTTSVWGFNHSGPENSYRQNWDVL